MKAKFRIISAIILLAGLASCNIGKPISTKPPQNNETYKIDYLFEHDGCKVYRFYDNGNYVYFTNRGGDVTSIATDSTKQRVETKGYGDKVFDK